MRKRKIIISILAVLLIAVLLDQYTGDFSKVSAIDASRIDKITIHTDWGKSKTITSTSDIHKIIDILNSTLYIRNVIRLPITGYLYKINFYESKEQKATLTLGGNLDINGKNYIVFGQVNMRKLEKVVGLYPPGNTS